MAMDVMESFGDGWHALNGTVPLQVPTRTGTFLLPAWRLHVPGFEEFLIVIHKSLKFYDGWVIAEGTTGMKMVESMSIDDAIETLKEFFAEQHVTPAWLREKVDAGRNQLASAAT